jgi:glucosamine--fructose-6-phosphate aminotransferase (isomerizing)
MLLGCGTSYFAGLCGKKYFKSLCDFNTVQVIDGAEFEMNDIPKQGKTALIFLSQSGETKDLYRCLEMTRDTDIIKIGVINVVDSLLAREADCGCYLNAGREIGVASTKSFTSQVIILSMMAIWFAQVKNINLSKRTVQCLDLRKLHLDIEQTMQNCDIDPLLPLFKDQNNCFILGKEIGHAIACEAALKIKELSYIHAEGYSSSSLKHGPFALLKKDFPVILIAPMNTYFSKNMNAYEEMKSRHANVIVVTNNTELNLPNTVLTANNDSYNDLLCLIPLQLLAFKLSLSRGYNPDLPRNLAKVVTVE